MAGKSTSDNNELSSRLSTSIACFLFYIPNHDMVCVLKVNKIKINIRLFFRMCHCFCREYSGTATGSSRAHNHNTGTREQTDVEHDERVINASNDEISTLN